jgi:hypothetical protein
MMSPILRLVALVFGVFSLLPQLSCSSVDVLRVQTGPPVVGGLAQDDIVVAIRARCLGFYVGTIGIPSCDLDTVMNGLLRETGKALGADRLLEVRFEATPDSGVWWLTKLLWFRQARVSALAVIGRTEPALAPATEQGQAAQTGGK